MSLKGQSLFGHSQPASVGFAFSQPSVNHSHNGLQKVQDTANTMAGVLKRSSNSVTVQIKASDDYTEWQEITVGGSVIFEWKVTIKENSNIMNYFIKFSKKIPSDKVNYIVTYTHWEVMKEMGTAVMRVRTDQFGAVYCPCTVPCGNTKVVTVEISTDQSSPCAIFYDVADFMLRGKDGSVPFHKVVLAAHSSEFKKMLAEEWKETSEGEIEHTGTSKEMLQHLNMYMYLGKLPEKQNDQVNCIKQLLLLSSRYLIEDLKRRCFKELRFLITKENVFDMIQFAMENKLNRLLINILDCANMCDVDLKEVQTYLEAKDSD